MPSLAPLPAEPCLRDYHPSFNANWISRIGTCVLVSTPKFEATVPSPLSDAILLVEGGAKLVRFAMLKNSARNWILKFSPSFLMWLSLVKDRSMLINPGPMTVLRPRLPIRLKQLRADTVDGEFTISVVSGTRAPFVPTGGFWSQFAVA